MIMLAKVGAYGGNAVRYAMEKEKAKVVKVNHLPEGLDLQTLSDEFSENLGEEIGTLHGVFRLFPVKRRVKGLHHAGLGRPSE